MMGTIFVHWLIMIWNKIYLWIPTRLIRVMMMATTIIIYNIVSCTLPFILKAHAQKRRIARSAPIFWGRKQVWLELIKTPEYKQGLKERYKIERKFGEAKQGHGLGRCRYVGRLRFAVQVFFTAIVLNLKRMVKLLTGVGFKTQSVSA